MRNSLIALFAAAALTACATTPNPLRDAEVAALSVAQVRASPQSFDGTRVRWGGSIVGVENRSDSTVLEVLARTLKSSGAPQPDGPGQGRFRARVAGFLDPSDYAEGRWVTVVGEVKGSENGRVGEFRYIFPVVKADILQLWRSREEIEPPPRPYYYPWYDPWWGPWGPGYHPWRRYPYWW